MIKIKGILNSCPEEIEGTNEWYSAIEGAVEACDLGMRIRNTMKI